MIPEELLRQAAEEAEEAILAGLPEETPHTFSPRFRRRIAPVLRRGSHPHRAAARAAGLILALLLTGFVWLSVDTQARNAVFTWLRGTVDSAFVYRFHNQQNVQSRSCRPGWLPEGYREVEFWDDDPGFTRIYENDNGDTIFFQYMFGNPDTALYIADAPPPTSIQVGDLTADYYPANIEGNNNCLVLIDPSANILFNIHANLTQDELVYLAQNIIVEKK